MYIKLICYFIKSIIAINGSYYSHQQLCSGLFAVDRKWHLTIQADSSFSYSIETMDTRAIEETTKEQFHGKWTLVADTLKLYPINILNKEIIFVMNVNTLLPVRQKADTINGFVIRLALLKKK
ncbi:MAG: lipocalin family protein [Chitinophagaceae bacterium]